MKNIEKRLFDRRNLHLFLVNFVTCFILLFAGIGLVSGTTITVQPGESIQAAINSLPDEGGIVKLTSGVHNVSDTIVINKSNVIIQGTHDSEIRSQDLNKDIFHVNPNWEGHLIENIMFKGFKVSCSYDYSLATNKLIGAANVNNLTIDSLYVLPSISTVLNLNWIWDAKGQVINKNLRVINNIFEYCSVGSVFCEDSIVRDNYLSGRHSGKCYGIFFEAGNTNVAIHDNYLENTGANANIQTESSNAHIYNNICKGSRVGISVRVGPDNVLVENNIITGASDAGIELRRQFPMNNEIIRNNIIYNCRGRYGYGIYVNEYGYGMSGSGNADISNNVIYNNGGDGIYQQPGTDWTLNVLNNIIVNNDGYGTNFEKGSRSYNDIWENAAGNYSGVSIGTGDISADPRFVSTLPSEEDFHLKSTAGRWRWINKEDGIGEWVTDDEDSPCIDAGIPYEENPIYGDYYNEPEPNGDKINLGAYGNTGEASLSSGKDLHPPVISSVNATEITSTSAKIIWVTNESSDSLVEYGTTTNYSSSASNVSFVINHSIALTNLNSNTTYHYRVKSKDAKGNIGTSGDYTFTTLKGTLSPDTTPPTISNVRVTGIPLVNATITWQTDKPATSQVTYGKTTSYGMKTGLDTVLVRFHNQTLMGLSPNTKYHFQTESIDESGNLGVSEDYTFITASLEEEKDVTIVYPNPWVGNKARSPKIYFVNLSKVATLRIYTISGELIKELKHKDTTDGGSAEWDILEIASGVYIYCIKSPSGVKKRGKVSIIR